MATRTCCSTGCTNAASMQCPTCLKQGINENSFFCSQTCFKASWATHKQIHKPADFQPLSWPGFYYSGTHRAWPQTPRRVIPEKIQKPDYAETGNPETEMAMRKEPIIRVLSPEDIERMRVVGKLGREVLDEAAKAVAVGVTTDELDRIVHEACVERDCYPSPLNYRGFPKSCCTSVNEIICHGIPDLYKLANGDIVNIDVSVYHRGFHTDLNETYFVGQVDEESKHLVKTTYECLQKSIEQVRPGTRYRDIGDIISKHAQAENLSVVRSYCGHGVNDLFHCAPSIPHYSKNKAVGTMKPGHTFTIEPMINIGTYRDMTWPDDWTSATVDGKRSAQFEHTLLVTDTGCEILTARTAASCRGPAWFDPAI